MLKESDVHIIGKAAIWMGALFSFILVMLAIANVFLPSEVSLAIDISLAFLVTLFTLFTGYTYSRIEHLASKQERILAQPFQGVEVYHTADDLLERLSEITVGAESVNTLNISPPRGTAIPLDKYFKEVHNYMKTNNSPLKSFRSIAYVMDEAKAKWIIERMGDCAKLGRFSQAIFDTEANNVFPIGFHAVHKEDDYYVFFFPDVNPAGAMRSFGIKNKFVHDIVSSYFDLMWARSIIVHEGAAIRREGLERLKKYSPQLEQDPHFTEIMQKFTNVY